MSNKAEEQSLDRIKEMAFCHKQREFTLMLTTCDAINIVDTNENILKNLPYYINLNKSKFVGLTFEEIKEIYLAINNAKFNDNNHKTEFPDFVLDNGFIEHFKLTSSIENKKGSAKKIQDAEVNRVIEPEKELFLKEFEKTVEIYTNQEKEWTYQDVSHSYENFVKSFKKQFEKHLNRLDKYKGNKGLKIFLIEYADNGLELIEEKYKNYSYYQKQSLNQEQHLWFYLLSKDKNMLEYLFDYKDELDYVIFDIENDFEIIKLNEIKRIFLSIKSDYVVIPKNNVITNSITCNRVRFNIK